MTRLPFELMRKWDNNIPVCSFIGILLTTTTTIILFYFTFNIYKSCLLLL